MWFRDDSKRLHGELSDFNKHFTKAAAANVYKSVVSITTHVPVETCPSFPDDSSVGEPPAKEVRFFGCGIIIECSLSSDSEYLCEILAPACLFKLPTDASMRQIEIDVHLYTGALHQAQVRACDFHYNLAAVTIVSHSPLPTVVFRHINDTLSIYPTDEPSLEPDTFKVSPDTHIASAFRKHNKPIDTYRGFATLCLWSPEEGFGEGFTCNELYDIKDVYRLDLNGMPALDSFGNVIGIFFDASCVLPSNIVSRWWNHFKRSGTFCRPYLGMTVVNLHEADLNFLVRFMTTFPGISTAVFVTKVEQDSRACHLGIRTNDVIVKVHGEVVKSKIKFYEAVWDNAGKAVTLEVLRVSDGEVLKVTLVIDETTPDKLHEWPLPVWDRVW